MIYFLQKESLSKYVYWKHDSVIFKHFIELDLVVLYRLGVRAIRLYCNVGTHLKKKKS